MSSKHSNHSTVGTSFIVETKAVELARSLLPKWWLWRRQEPDFFVDYDVEIVRDGEPTGLHFAVQIKGTERLIIRKGGIRFRMSRKHLRYYKHNARVPVFIVLVDVDKERGYWLFAQQYLREQAAAADLKNQNTLTINFSAEDCLSDISRFKEAITNAATYMRELYPGSVTAAVEQRRNFVQQLDPSIGVEVSVHNGREVLQLFPSAPLSLTFTSRELEARERFYSMVKRGDVFLADMELLDPLDSPLMSKLMPVGRYRLRFDPETRAGSAQLQWGNRPHVLHVDGSWKGGTETMRFIGSLPRSPLSIEVAIDRAANEDGFSLSVSTPLRLDVWEGQPVRHLAWFDELQGLVSALATQQQVELTYFVEGIRVGSGLLSATSSEINANLHRELDWLARVKFLADYYEVDARLPKATEISYQVERELDALWALTRGDSFQDEIPGATFGFSLESDTPLPHHWKSRDSPMHGTMKITGSAAFDLFGHTVEVLGVENMMTDVKLVSFEDTPPGSKKRLSFRGGENAVWFRRKLKS